MQENGDRYYGLSLMTPWGILCSPNGFVFANSMVGVRNYLPSGSIRFDVLEILLDRGVCEEKDP